MEASFPTHVQRVQCLCHHLRELHGDSPLSVDGPVVEPIKEVNDVGAEENKTYLPRRHGVRFDPPLNLCSDVPIAPFPSRLAIAKVVAREDEVKCI